MTEQQRAFNPDRAAMAAVSSIEETMAIGRFGAQKSAQIQEIIVDTIRAALTHAEGEAFGWFTEDHDTDKSATTYDPVVADRWRGKGWPVWPLYTHPAPHCPVCMLDERDELRGEVKRLLAEAEYADRILRSSVPERHKGVTSPIGAVQNYIAELETAPQVAVPEGFTVVPVREFYVMSEDEDIIGGIGNDFEAGKHLLKLAQEGEPEKAWGLVADIDQTKLAAAPTAPAGDLRPDCSVCGDFGSDCDVCGAPSRQPVSDPDGLGAERARRLETATVAKLLLNAWAESEPDHPVTKHPASYAETFTDMAKAMMPLMAAPDEREIAARAIERAVGDYFKAEDGPHNLHDYLLWRVNRLRAGKEGEPS